MHNRASKQIKTSEKNLILGEERKTKKKVFQQDNWSYTIFLFTKNLLGYVRGFDFIDKRTAEAEVGKVIAKTGFCLTFAQLLLLGSLGLLVPNPWAAASEGSRVQQLNMSEIIFIKLTCMSTLLTLCRQQMPLLFDQLFVICTLLISFICFRHVLGLDCVCNKSWTKTTLMVLACRIESKDKATAGRTQDAGQQPQKSQMVNIQSKANKKGTINQKHKTLSSQSNNVSKLADIK